MSENSGALRSGRLLIFGLLVVIIVLGAALIVMAIGRAGAPATAEEMDALANSNNECVVCHRRTTPGIVKQYGASTMAMANVSCQQCHEVAENYPGSGSTKAPTC